MTTQDLITIQEVTERTGVSASTIRREIKKGALKPDPVSSRVRVYLFDPEEVDYWARKYNAAKPCYKASIPPVKEPVKESPVAKLLRDEFTTADLASFKRDLELFGTPSKMA